MWGHPNRPSDVVRPRPQTLAVLGKEFSLSLMRAGDTAHQLLGYVPTSRPDDVILLPDDRRCQP